MTAVDFEAFVDELATLSGTAIMPFFRTALGIEDKSGGTSFDPVTEADRAAEAAIRHKIRSTFPAHGVMGEEYGSERLDAEFVWVLDPIDGTKTFIAGNAGLGHADRALPQWPALLRHDAPALHQGTLLRRWRLGEISRAGRASVSFGRGPARALKDAVLYTTTPRLMPARRSVVSSRGSRIR